MSSTDAKNGIRQPHVVNHSVPPMLRRPNSPVASSAPAGFPAWAKAP
ncbi:MAG TPA: hypothetical protein VFG15_29650 [Amycolatopsis sp.]|nr:hypothetical protein [Amycolatopsis sp.]